MTVDDAIKTLGEEIRKSQGRCQCPYVMTVSPCELEGKKGPEAGVYMGVSSDVFGKIASSRARTLKAALLDLAEKLRETRKGRWAAESPAPAAKSAGRERKR